MRERERRAKVKDFYHYRFDGIRIARGKKRDDKPFVVEVCHVDGNRRDGMREEIFLETAKPIGAFQSVETLAG